MNWYLKSNGWFTNLWIIWYSCQVQRGGSHDYESKSCSMESGNIVIQGTNWDLSQINASFALSNGQLCVGQMKLMQSDILC